MLAGESGAAAATPVQFITVSKDKRYLRAPDSAHEPIAPTTGIVVFRTVRLGLPGGIFATVRHWNIIFC